MPRDGSGTYTQPFPNVVEGTPIESTVYNGYTADITIDLNTPRPIVSGGTGATSAEAALDAFSGEIARVQVTNYNSHNFKSGSFYSLSSATDAPVAGHSFSGHCYPAVVGGVATTDMFIEARDMSDGSIPPRVYVRQKIANVWGSWMVPATGGVDPDFSGMIYINDRHFATNTATNTYILTPSSQFPSNGAAITLSDTGETNTYQANAHSFTSLTGGSFIERFRVTDTAATFNVPLSLAHANGGTVIAPASTDNSTRIPSTAWVRTNATDTVLSTGLPQNIRSGAAYTLVLGDAGKHIFHPASDAQARVFTIPANASVAFPIGTLVHFVNFGGTVTISCGDTMYIAGTSSSGNRTLSSTRGLANVLKVDSTTWIIWGEGLT